MSYLLIYFEFTGTYTSSIHNSFPDYGYILFCCIVSSVPSTPRLFNLYHRVQDHRLFWKEDYQPGLLQLNTFLYMLYPEDRAIPPLKVNSNPRQQPLRPVKQKGLNTIDVKWRHPPFIFYKRRTIL